MLQLAGVCWNTSPGPWYWFPGDGTHGTSGGLRNQSFPLGTYLRLPNSKSHCLSCLFHFVAGLK